MSLAPGARIASYEVVVAIGAGGMGEVYRARDTRLGRDVALKILPGVLGLDADRQARFEREATTLASLNHPNIAHVYDAGKDATGAYLVMELVEGEDLAVHIARGALPVAEVRPIALQIVDAIEAAHEAGIIHRDLKPANIKLRADGTVKVLDFGLAKALGSDPSSVTAGDAANSPTLTARATQMGMILGTAAYMAPEQARGRAVDRRADIWAFGVVLYEMLTGRRAFEGEDVSITLAGVLKEDVEWTALPADLPVSWRRLLRRCLEKDPRRRLSAIGDARLELEDVQGQDADAAIADVSSAAEQARLVRAHRRAWLVAGAATLTALLALTALAWPRPAAPDPPRIAFSWSAYNVTTFAGIYPAVSPDGRWVAYSAASEPGTPTLIWLRPLGSESARALAGTERANFITWSPDSRFLAFVSAGRLGRVSLDGAVERFGEVAGVTGITWLPDGDLLVTTNPGEGNALHRVPAGGGAPVRLTLATETGPAGSPMSPVLLPDGRRFLYLGWSGDPAERALFVGSLDGTPATRLMASVASGTYADGHLFFVRDQSLYAQPFDPSSLELSGDQIRLADDVAVSTLSGRAAFGASNAGVIAYRRGAVAGLQADLAWFDRSGKPLGMVGDGGNIYQIRLSPDGRRVAIAGGPDSVFRLSVLDLGNGVTSRVTNATTEANDPVWSPDSGTIAYEAVKDGGRQLFTHEVGSSTPVLAFESPDNLKWLDDWSGDGQWLLFHRPRPAGGLYAVKPGDPSSVTTMAGAGEAVDGAHFSPDGQWVAYQTADSGRPNVWVASFPAFDRRRQVSRQGGGQAMWRGDGRELFFLTPDGRMMSVAVTPQASGSLDFSAPVELFQTPLPTPSLGIDQYSVTRDGQRFLLIQPRAIAGGEQRINVIVNWKSGT